MYPESPERWTRYLNKIIALLSLRMAVYFQKVSDDQFNASADYVVKESKGVNLIRGIFFFILGLGFVSISWYGWFLVVASIAVVARAFREDVSMIVNKVGFFYYGQLITDWDHFISEEFIDDGPATPRRAGKDQFYLMIKYYKEGQPGYYGRKIPFTDTQDKSEEEIMAAIRFYYKNRETVNQ